VTASLEFMGCPEGQRPARRLGFGVGAIAGTSARRPRPRHERLDLMSVLEQTSGQRRRLGRRTRLLVIAAVLIVLAAVAWQFWLSPTAQARRMLINLGAPLPGIEASSISTAHPGCEGTSGCVSVSRSWSPSGSLTLASFTTQARSWVSQQGLNGDGQWTCGPQQGAFGIVSPGGGCSMALTNKDAHHTPVFLWVSFKRPSELATAYARSSQTVPANEIADPLQRLGALELARVNLQVVSTT
jgi:hypothetical protein